MNKAKRICIITDLSNKPIKMFSDQTLKLAKGFIRLGHDVRFFSYCDALSQISPFKSKTFSEFFYKKRVDEVLAEQLKNYQPDIVYINFARALNADTIIRARQSVPNAVFIGSDGDPWPKLQKNRIETAKELDILTATNDGQWLQDYRDAGVPLCIFLPNLCDPDIDHRYDVEEKWKTDILWIGKLHHHADTSETFREELVKKLATRENSSLYGCFGRPTIGGLDFLYAISGARIGVNVNAYRPVKFCHSDRITRYMACGTFVMARRFPGADLLYKDGEHIKYFDEIKEFFELSDWYLGHEDQRKKIADAGMKRIHEQFNCVKIAGYIIELAEKGEYKAPWN
ncbi:MAG: glycosyltransferase family 1 protein [Sedimentisphaerales bacterium]|nr:glycosyltransferase family 1 protein [Sedimentisphaerales bacterium]